MNKINISEYTQNWITAVQTYNPKDVLKLYDKNAVLLPTLSNQVCNTHEKIENYFKQFLAKEPQCNILESYSRLYTNHTIAIHSGIYSFMFKDKSQKEARFTFVYEIKDNHALIIEHHSSLMPL